MMILIDYYYHHIPLLNLEVQNHIPPPSQSISLSLFLHFLIIIIIIIIMSLCCRQITTTTVSSSSSVLELLPLPKPLFTISFSPVRQRVVVPRSPPPPLHHLTTTWLIKSTSLKAVAKRRKRIQCCLSSTTTAVGEKREDAGDGDGDDRDRKVKVLVAAAATVVLGVGNRVLYKLALVPLKQYPFFLAQLATFGYVLVYFSILYFRYRAGIVTDEMLSLPKTPFLIVGLLEALAAASGMAAGAILSGASIPILSQTFLIWQLLLSALLLRRQYRINQIVGCLLVAIGVIITVASGSGGGLSLTDGGLFWTLMMVTSFFLQAADTVMKEIIFVGAAKQLKGGSVDLFVVNSYGSAFQAMFICLLLPFLSKLWGIPFGQLPSYLKDGAACFLNIGSLSTGCGGAPLLPLLFIVVNMAFNVSLLHLLKISSAVVSCLASTFSVPLSVYAFTLPLPYVGVASSLPSGFVMGVVVLVAGLLVYSWVPSAHVGSMAAPVDH